MSTWAWGAAAIAVVVYIPSLWNGLAYDDVIIITDNVGLRSWRNWGELLTSPYWPVEDGRALGLWRPTTTLMLSIVWQLSEGAAWAFHLVNVAVHAAVTLLVVRVAAQVVSVAAAGLAGLFFAVHPVHVEAVANGIGLGELLAAVFVLAALHLVLERERLSAGGLALVLALFALGFGAQEGAVVLPGLVFVADAVRDRLRIADLGLWIRRRAALLAGLVAVTGSMLWARSQILDGMASALPPLGASLLAEVPRIWTLGEIWYQMLRVLLVPTWLSPDYSPDLIPVVLWWTPRGTVGVLAVLAVLAGAWYAARRLRPLDDSQAPRDAGDGAIGVAFGVGWFLVAISPVSNVPFLTGILLAERTLYLPSVGVAVALAGLLAGSLVHAPSARSVRLAGFTLLVFLVMAWTTRTVTYIPVWRDNSTLFTYMARYIPESVRSQLFRGDFLLERGEEERAILHHRVALRRATPGHSNLMEKVPVYLQMGFPRMAYLYAARAHAWREDPPTTLMMLSIAAREAGNLDAAEYWGRRAVEAAPESGSAWYALGNALARQGEWAEAAEARVREAATLDSTAWQPWFAVVEYRARAGNESGALAAVDSVLSRTSDPEALQELDSLLVEVGLPRR